MARLEKLEEISIPALYSELQPGDQRGHLEKMIVIVYLLHGRFQPQLETIQIKRLLALTAKSLLAILQNSRSM